MTQKKLPSKTKTSLDLTSICQSPDETFSKILQHAFLQASKKMISNTKANKLMFNNWPLKIQINGVEML